MSSFITVFRLSELDYDIRSASDLSLLSSFLSPLFSRFYRGLFSSQQRLRGFIPAYVPFHKAAFPGYL